MVAAIPNFADKRVLLAPLPLWRAASQQRSEPTLAGCVGTTADRRAIGKEASWIVSKFWMRRCGRKSPGVIEEAERAAELQVIWIARQGNGHIVAMEGPGDPDVATGDIFFIAEVSPRKA